MLPKGDLTLDQRSAELYNHFVPKNHPLRKIDEAIDFSFILPLVKDRYDPWVGRYGKHPEQMWRLLFAQFHMNLSDEKIIVEAHVNLALRGLLRLGMDEKPCHPTTLQKFRFNRLDNDIYLKIHFELLRQAEENGLLNRDERQIFDTSHVRSNTRVVSTAYLLLQARRLVIREVKKIDDSFGQQLEEQAEAERAAYREERKKRHEQGLPKLTKEEKIASVTNVVRKTLEEVLGRIAGGQLEATERLNVALAILEKVIKDREKDAKERIVSVHDPEARKGAKGNFRWDGRKLAINMQEESYLIVAAESAPGNANDCTLVEPLLDQQKEEMKMVPPELTADKGADTGPIRDMLHERQILGHIPMTKTTNARGADLYKVRDFIYDPEAKTVTSRAGKTTKAAFRDKAQSRDGYTYMFQKRWCKVCEQRYWCRGSYPTENLRHGRYVYISMHWIAYDEAYSHNKSKEFEEAYGKRGRVEAKISELVYHGARRCRYRGQFTKLGAATNHGGRGEREEDHQTVGTIACGSHISRGGVRPSSSLIGSMKRHRGQKKGRLSAN
ncbi:MAG: transposase [Chloroflexi bacterium]|nr:transposase [Chloroflexota bacterium]